MALKSPTHVAISSSAHRFRFFVASLSWLGCNALCLSSFSSLRVLMLLSSCRRVPCFVVLLSSCRRIAFYVSSYCFLRVAVLSVSSYCFLRFVVLTLE